MSDQEVWNSYALSYDTVLPLLSFYQETVARHFDAMTVSDLNEVLDVGAGTGNIAIPLAEKGIRVTAIDLSGAMLEKLQAKITKSSAENIIVRHQNSEDLSQWESASFDGVTILLALFGMNHPEEALGEAVRLLRPGGRIVITEPNRCFQLKPLLDRAKQELCDQGVYENLRTDWDRVYRANIENDPSDQEGRLFADDIRNHLRSNGFTKLTTEDSHFGHCTTIWGTKSLEDLG